MPLLLNSAGGSAADPILEDLPLSLIGGADTLDIAQNVRAYIDLATGTGSNEVTSGLSPDPTTVFTAGTNGAWTAATKTFIFGNNTGIDIGDYMYVDNGSVATLAKVASKVSTNGVTFTETVFASDASGVSYQVHYTYDTSFTEAGALRATLAGQINYVKFQAEDSFGNMGSKEETIYGRLDPAGSAFIEIAGGNYTGQTIQTFAPTFNVLGGWANRGGILTLELITPTGMRWWDGTTGEKLVSTIFAQAEASRLQLHGGDGLKSATLRMRTSQGSPNYRDVPISVSVDSSAPNIIINVRGR
jgi:hypothetical protein